MARRSRLGPFGGSVVRVVLVVTGLVLGGILGLSVGMVFAGVLVNLLGPLDEANYFGTKFLVPLAAAALAAVAGGVIAARSGRR
jgi:hypothetical protein